MNRRLVLLIIAMLVLLPAWVVADDKVGWTSLTQTQQKTLDRFKDRWTEFPVERQQRLLKGANSWANLNQEQRSVLKQRFKQWKKLPPERKKQLRKKFKKFKTLSVKERRLVRKKFHWFKSLPPQKRKQLRKKWKKLTPEQRNRIKKRIRKQRHRR